MGCSIFYQDIWAEAASLSMHYGCWRQTPGENWQQRWPYRSNILAGYESSCLIYKSQYFFIKLMVIEAIQHHIPRTGPKSVALLWMTAGPTMTVFQLLYKALGALFYTHCLLHGTSWSIVYLMGLCATAGKNLYKITMY